MLSLSPQSAQKIAKCPLKKGCFFETMALMTLLDFTSQFSTLTFTAALVVTTMTF
jgi:hypothetical protein